MSPLTHSLQCRHLTEAHQSDLYAPHPVTTQREFEAIKSRAMDKMITNLNLCRTKKDVADLYDLAATEIRYFSELTKACADNCPANGIVVRLSLHSQLEDVRRGINKAFDEHRHNLPDADYSTIDTRLTNLKATAFTKPTNQFISEMRPLLREIQDANRPISFGQTMHHDVLAVSEKNYHAAVLIKKVGVAHKLAQTADRGARASLQAEQAALNQLPERIVPRREPKIKKPNYF